MRTVYGLDSLRALEPAWWSLWHADPAATPFHSPAWLLPWAAVFQPGSCCAVVGEGSFLLPLFTLDGGRHVLPLGAGTTDWLGPLCTRLPDAPIPWPDTAALIDLPGLSTTTPPLQSPPGWREEGGEGEPCPALDLPAALPKSLRQNLRTARHRLDRLGKAAIHRVTGPDIPPTLDALFALHSARWQQDGDPGVLADPLVQAFHRQAAPRLDAAGLLRLYALELDGRIVAVLYGLSAKGRFHYYIGGHAPALAACSPGSLLLAHAIAEATAEGCTLFDFLRGREPYKYRWGATDRPSRWRRLTRDLP